VCNSYHEKAAETIFVFWPVITGILILMMMMDYEMNRSEELFTFSLICRNS
jgi:hypothetical protein